MSDHFEFDPYAVLADIKNRDQPQCNRNQKEVVNLCGINKTASTSGTAIEHADNVLLPQSKIKSANQQELKGMPAVIAVPAVTQTGWQNLEKSSCGSAEEVAVVSVSCIKNDPLNWWLEQLSLCSSRQSVFDLLKQFQPLSWSDNERAEISQRYHRRLGEVLL